MSSYIKLRAELYLNFTSKIKNIRHNSEQTAYRNDFSFVLAILLISKKIDRVKRFINKKNGDIPKTAVYKSKSKDISYLYFKVLN